jgi:hypothetical protein
MSDLPKIFHLQFDPARWTQLERLRAMLGKPLPTTRASYQALDACLGHLQKYQALCRVAARIIPNLPKDRLELETYGASRNLHCEEFGALLEAMLCELYESLDGLRHLLCVVYPKAQGLQDKSNEKLFQRAKNKRYSADFPEPIRIALAAAYDDWFPKLHELRTKITHGTVGSFYLDEKQESVNYINEGLSSLNQVFAIKDILSTVRAYDANVRSLLETIAGFFLAQLLPIPRMYPCGVYLGRMYIRMVAPTTDMTIHSGHCASWDWFEKEPGLFCPLARQCSAYTRKWPGGNAAALAASR